jgi:type II secretory pathway pseudopilin PulG
MSGKALFLILSTLAHSGWVHSSPQGQGQGQVQQQQQVQQAQMTSASSSSNGNQGGNLVAIKLQEPVVGPVLGVYSGYSSRNPNNPTNANNGYTYTTGKVFPDNVYIFN